MDFFATELRVSNQGRPPKEFLVEEIEWARSAPDEIFAPNPNPADIYAHVAPILGPFTSLLYRKAVMLEVMRVHAGFESSWKWHEGVDITNKSSMKFKERQETGIFQVSFDSLDLGDGAMKPFAVEKGIDEVDSFISKMKTDHALALEYYARLVRVSVRWAGPIVRHEIDIWLSRSAVKEFEQLVS